MPSYIPEALGTGAKMYGAPNIIVCDAPNSKNRFFRYSSSTSVNVDIRLIYTDNTVYYTAVVFIPIQCKIIITTTISSIKLNF